MQNRYKKKFTTADAVRQRAVKGTKQAKEIDKILKNILRLRDHLNTKSFTYNDYKEAYDYVDNLFPESNVKEITVYKAPSTLMYKYGFGGAGGFYNKTYKVIIFSGKKKTPKKSYSDRFSVSAKLNPDEVIVHELLHYCYFEEGKSSGSTALQEEFAYGWSIGYLRDKGYTDEEIIRDNFMPFLYGNVQNDAVINIFRNNGIDPNEYNDFHANKQQRIMKKYRKEIYNRCIKEATEIGQQLINLYSKKLETGPISNSTKNHVSPGFTFLDLDDDD